MCSVNILIEIVGFYMLQIPEKFDKRWKKFLSGQKRVQFSQIWPFPWNKIIHKLFFKNVS